MSMFSWEILRNFLRAAVATAGAGDRARESPRTQVVYKQ